MASTTVSTKYQVVIPKEIREQMPIEPGQVFHVIAKGGVITLVPDKPISEFRGFLKGMKAEGYREKRDRM